MSVGPETSDANSPGPGREILRASETRATLIVPQYERMPRELHPGEVCLDPNSPLWRAVSNAWAWDNCDDPRLMLPLLNGWSSPRKLRLLACAIVRHLPFGIDGQSIWELLPSFGWYEGMLDGRLINCREVIQGCEGFADGLIDGEQWSDFQQFGHYAEWTAEADTFGYHPERFENSGFRYAAACAIAHASGNMMGDRFIQWLINYHHYGEPGSIHQEHLKGVCRLIDDLHGNPFRPDIVRRDRLSETALDLARTIYEDRAFDLMPILGDALEEAGCFDGEVLRHCRQGGLHARGCWVIDQITMREWLPYGTHKSNARPR